jgi:YVTN family beta-propeller protein
LAGALLLVLALWALPGLGTVGAAPSVSASLSYSAPGTLSYQGRVHVEGTPFDGTGQFKFAIVDAAGTQMYWANDGSTGAVMEPGTAVSVPVEDGLFNVLLGDTSLSNMDVEIPADAFSEPDRALRVWFNDGTNGFEMLTPDTPLASVPYAFQADQARVAPNLERIALLKWREGGLYTSAPDFVFAEALPQYLAYDGEYMWMTHRDADCVSRFHADTGMYDDCYPVGQQPQGLAYDGRHVWIANSDDNTVTIRDASTTLSRGTFPTGNTPIGVAYTGGATWIANLNDDTITVYDPNFNLVATHDVGDGPRFMALDGQYMWVTLSNDNAVQVLNLAGSIEATISVGDNPSGIAFDGRYMWVANRNDDTLTAIDVAGREVAMIISDDSFSNPTDLAFDGKHIWVTNFDDDTATVLDAATGEVVRVVLTENGPKGIAFSGADMWIANEISGYYSKR